jgi:hypothetical protein
LPDCWDLFQLPAHYPCYYCTCHVNNILPCGWRSNAFCKILCWNPGDCWTPVGAVTSSSHPLLLFFFVILSWSRESFSPIRHSHLKITFSRWIRRDVVRGRGGADKMAISVNLTGRQPVSSVQ